MARIRRKDELDSGIKLDVGKVEPDEQFRLWLPTDVTACDLLDQMLDIALGLGSQLIIPDWMEVAPALWPWSCSTLLSSNAGAGGSTK